MSESVLKQIWETKEARLKTLNLSGYGFSKLPKELKTLYHLKTLELHSNEIEDISILASLTNLETLNLSSNYLNNIEALKFLPRLQSLNISFNQIKDISSLSILSELKNIDLSFNKVSDISPLTSLTQLRTLKINANNIKEFNYISHLTGLQHLEIGSNRLDEISGISLLVNLVSLNLADNQIFDISSISNLTQLQSLFLNINKINDISSLTQLTKLKDLYLYSNEISDISNLSTLKQLQNLDLSANHINNITSLTQLTKLKDLYLNANQISDISNLSTLKQLQNLDLSSNRINDITALSLLTNLKSLNLNSNPIENISSLKMLANLHSINLGNCKIIKLDDLLNHVLKGLPIIWEASEGKGINIYNNPFTSLPPEIINEGPNSIINYYEELAKGEDETVFEAKLLIIGEAGAGKTTLARKIINLEASVPDEILETTKGIDILPHIFPSFRDQPEFLMNIWDFGGQAIYHSTHQFFLSKRSLYVLLADGRKEENLDYWLQVQELLAGKSPMLIVLNQKGTIKPEIPITEIRGFYGNVKNLYIVNLKDDLSNSKTLKNAIEFEIRNLDHLKQGEKLPKVWVDIRRELEGREENYIYWSEFRNICKKEGIEERNRQLFLLDYLHDLGAILNFQDVPVLKNIIILKPQWATEAVYKVLDHTKGQKRSGHFHRDDLDKVWADNSYEDVFDELLALMERFGICYQLPEDENEFIVPLLLPGDRPEFEWEAKNHIELRYKYDFMPKGIITQLVVKLHDIIENQEKVWKRGSVFKHNGDATALAFEDPRQKEIVIQAEGKFARDLMTVIVREVDGINDTFHFSDRMQVHKMIPCNCQECLGASYPHFYDYQKIMKKLERNRSTIECYNSDIDVSLSDLLDRTFDRQLMAKGKEPKAKKIDIYEEVGKLVEKGELNESLDKMEAYFEGDRDSLNMVISLRARLNELSNKQAKGIIKDDDLVVEKNKIVNSIIQLSDSR